MRNKKLNKFTRNSKIEIIIAVYFAFKSLFQPNIISFELEVKLFILNMSQSTKIPNKNKDCADISKSPLPTRDGKKAHKNVKRVNGIGKFIWKRSSDAAVRRRKEVNTNDIDFALHKYI